MRKIGFTLERVIISRRYYAAYVVDDDDVAEELGDAVVQSISTDIEVQLGGVTIHLAAILDPEHWETDWQEKGVDDPRAFLAGLVEVA